MQFLAPLFLVALAGLAIPVLLHLTQREKKQIVRFPSLMFVRRIPYQSVRRRKIQNWLLLMVRMAALALIVAAFARPLIRQTDALVMPGSGARERVVLLDTSYSMGYGDRWEQARRAATEAVADLSSSDRASLVLFSSGTDIAVRSTAERDTLSAAVAAAAPTAGATRYAPALKVAGSILAESTLPRREVVLISDFQRSGWKGEEGARLPPGTTLSPVRIDSPLDRPNVSVSGVSMARSTFAEQERLTVTAGLVNRTERPVTGLSVRLEVGNIPVGTRTVSIDPGGTATVSFDPFTLSASNMRAVVRIAPDALPADDAYYFVVSPARPLQVTLVDRGTVETRRYLEQALAIGDAPKFATVTRQPDAVTDQDLQRSAVVIVNDVPVSAGLARRLQRFVEGGGGLFVAGGGQASWPQDVDLLPGTFGPPVDRQRGEPARVGQLEYGHPVFEPFRAPRSGNFTAARIQAYRRLSATSDAQVLASLDAGSPAMLERRVGAGRVLLWATALDRSASDLPINPVFPVFVQQSMLHLAAYREPQPSVTVGQVLDPSIGSAVRGEQTSRFVVTPSSRRLPFQDEGSEVLELSEAGFYEIRGGTGDTEVAVVAANVDPAEADLTSMDPNDIVLAAAGGQGTGAATASQAVPLSADAQERNQRLWWYLLCAGILLLGLDTVMSNRLAKT
jgi:hypothetical protein